MNTPAAAPVVAVLGLGEAGSEIVADLLAAGVVVRAYDPEVPAPAGTVGCRDEADAATGADLVLSVNSADDALTAATHRGPGCHPRAIWAELNTASPGRKQEVAAALDALPDGPVFVDVALMSTVPGKGIRTPMTVSGPAAQAYADLVTPLGAAVTVLDGPIGEAARRKLLRSVFFKGMSAAVTEAVAAASAFGLEDWVRTEIATELERLDGAMLRRIEEGSRTHAVRRSHEMAAATEMLTDAGVPARISAASRDWLTQLSRG